MKKKKFILTLIVVLVIAVIAYVSITSKNNDEEIEETKPKKQVKIQNIQKQEEVITDLTASGTVVPKQYTQIRSLTQGTLEYISPVGQEIKAGESLFRIRDDSVENNYFNALQNLNQTNVIVEERISQSQLALSSSQARFDLSTKNLATTQKQTEQAINNANSSAVVVYNSAYNTLNQVFAFISSGNVSNFEFLYKNLRTAQIQLLNQTNLQYLVATEQFLKLEENSNSDDLNLSLNEIHSILFETKLLIDSTVVLLQDGLGGTGLEGRSMENDKIIMTTYQTQINQHIVSVLASQNGLKNTEINNQLSIDLATNQLELAQIELNNSQIALESTQNSAVLERTISQGQFDNASYGYNNLFLASPFSGTILSHAAQVGQQVSPGGEILELGNLSIVEIEVDVDTEFAKSLKQQDSVQISDKCPGFISEIEPAGSIASGKMGVTVQCESPEDGLVAGDIAEVKFSLTYSEPGLIIVPINSATIEPALTYVFVLEDGVAVKQPVVLGKIFGDRVSVISGLKENDQLILRKGIFVSEGEEIQIIE